MCRHDAYSLLPGMYACLFGIVPVLAIIIGKEQNSRRVTGTRADGLYLCQHLLALQDINLL